MSPRPLSNIRILDFTQNLPGPLCTLLLTDLGAETIKIEGKNRPDPVRFAYQAKGKPAAFHALNRGKKSLTLDLKKEEDIQQLQKLMPSVDVVVESFRPGVFERLCGLGSMEEIRKRFPKIIICRISSFGQVNHRWQTVPAHDLNSVGSSGLMDLLPEVDSPLPIQIADLLTGYSSALMVVSAILKRKNTNQGSVIDASLYDSALSTLIMPFTQMMNSNVKISGGNDMLVGSIAAYDVYTCMNGTKLAVGCLELHFWKQFVNALGLSEEYIQLGFVKGGRKKGIKANIEKVLASKTADEWEKLMGFELKLPVTKVRSAKEAMDDELVALRGMIVNLKNDLKVLCPALDYTSFLDGANSTPGPELGQHNQKLLSKL